MGDLFDPAIPDEFRDKVFNTMRRAEQHRFLVLTKRAGEMRSCVERWMCEHFMVDNVWFGVTVTNQADADERIPILLDTPAAHRWASYEPALGPVDFREWLRPLHHQNPRSIADYNIPTGQAGIGWLVAGPLTGSSRLYSSPTWLQSAYEQCRAAGVPFFDKRESFLARERPF
jgi:protein gp37